MDDRTNIELRLLLMVLLGALMLSPLVGRLPMLGWDWFYFFNANNPTYNILNSNHAYPPYTRYVLGLLTWMDWRDSLTLLNSITLMTIAMTTWKIGGRYGSMVLALLSPPVWFLLWIGHPDGLALLGSLINFAPLALTKPNLVGFTLLRSKSLILQTVIFLLFTLVAWGFWPVRFGSATFTHPASLSWMLLGWPVLLVGIFMLLGAGKDFTRLIAAGCLISPHLMAYHLALLAPAVGSVKGPKKFVLWSSSWLVVLALGYGSTVKYLYLVYPVLAYAFSISPQEYLVNVRRLWQEFNTGLETTVSVCSAWVTQWGRRTSLRSTPPPQFPPSS